MEAEAKGEGETLARHEHILLELANKKDLKIGKIYKEIVSGETIETRPEMQKLLADVRQGKWKGVLVVEVERLARGETIDQGIVAKAFRISNTKILTPMKTYDPNNEFDEEYFEFGLFMSRREYKVINRRLQRGRMISVSEGKYVGSIAPFGYDRIKIKGDKGYTLKENKEESNIVKIIYDLYAYNDLSLNEITRKLNEMGFKPRKNDKWSISSVKEILANPVYIGKIKWNSRKEVKIYKNEKIIKTRPRNNDYILVNGLHKNIISEKTWNIVNIKRSVNLAPVTHNNVIQNPLCGLIICGKCGKKMLRRAYTNQEPILYCPNPECNNISTKLKLVEEKLLEGLKKWLEPSEFDYTKYLEKTSCNKIDMIKKMIEFLELEAKKENDKLLKIFDLLEKEIYTVEIFNSRKKLILENLEKINNSIENYKVELEKEEKNYEKREIRIPKLENFLDIYDLLKMPEEKNEFLKILITRSFIFENRKSNKKRF